MPPIGREHASLASFEESYAQLLDLDGLRSGGCRGVSAANPARGQCGTTALTINDLLGGELLVAEVLHADGSRQGVHWWNRLPDGTEIDLTREQFPSHEVIQQPRAMQRPSELSKRAAEQYLTLKQRVLHALGLTEANDIR
jgi:hypothetical protein